MAFPASIQKIIDKKKSGRKILMLTAYDYPLASIIDRSGIDIILVGDSLANVALGLSSTKEVDIEIMIHHAKAVRRAVKHSILVGDMPYSSLHNGVKKAVADARRFMKEAGCDAVKMEWFDDCLKVTKDIIKDGIAVMGHVGLTPQTADKMGGLKVQGKEASAAKNIIDQAKALEETGIFSLVLECIPCGIAEIITKTLNIPTIGIGAGPYCDGQVLVTHDLIGLFAGKTPKFAKRYVDVSHMIREGISQFKNEVEGEKFPDSEHTFFMDHEEYQKLKDSFGK